MASLPYPRSHKTIFPQNPTQPNHLCASVKSVGEYSSPVVSVGSANSVGGLQRVAWVWQDAIPSYKNSHRLHCHATTTILPRNNNKIATLQQQDCHATIKHRKRTSNQETNKQSRNERTPTLHISRETVGKCAGRCAGR